MSSMMSMTAMLRRRAQLHASTAVAGGALVALMIAPHPALSASCAGQNTANVVCDNVTTTNLSERLTTNPTPTTVLIGPGFLNGFGLQAVQSGAGTSLTVTNTGTLTLDNAAANTLPALHLVGNGGTVTYGGTGSISNSLLTPLSTGLEITNAPGGSVFINNSGPITGFNGVLATVQGAGEFHITNSSTITGTLNDGLDVSGAQGANNTIVNTGTIRSLANAFGIHVGNNSTSAGTVTVTNSGTIEAGFRGIAVDWVPAGVVAPDGGVTVLSTGNVTVGDLGIHVLTNTGPISITANNVTSGFHGIQASSLSGNVAITTTGTINANTTGNGIHIDTGGQFLTVNVQSGSVFAADGHGIFVLATASALHPDSNVGVTVNSGTSVATGSPVDFWGIDARHNSGSGSNNLLINGSVVGGISSIVVGTGTNLISVSGTVTNSVNEGISASALNGVTDINNTGSVTGFTSGISAQSSGAGSIFVTNAGIASGTTSFGIRTSAGSGETKITNSGNATGANAGISAASGSGPITISNTGNVAGGNAIFASGAGAISITNSGLLTSPGTGNEDAVVHVSSSTGTIAITNDLGGLVRSFTGVPTGLAIETAGVAATVANAGTLTGRLQLNGLNNVVTNTGIWSTSGANTVNGSILNSGTFITSGSTSFAGLTGFTNPGTFNASGTTAFGGGSFTNNRIVNLAAGSVELLSLSAFQNNGAILASPVGTSNATVQAATFTNAGSINLQNSRVGDTFTINGNYVGVPGSLIALDFATQSGTADRVTINGNASGATALLLNNVTPLAPFATTTSLVEVSGTTTPGLFTLVGLQNVSPLTSFLLVSESVGAGQRFSLGAVPTAAGLSGAIASLAAFNIGFLTQDAVFDHMQDIRNDTRRRLAPPTPGSQVMSYQPVAMKRGAIVEKAQAPVGPTFRPAAWVRGYGDVENRDEQATFNFGGVSFAPDLGYRQQTYGAMGGADVVIGNLTSSQDGLILGAFGGSIDSVVDLDRSATRLKFSGGTVGGYATYLHGPWFADLILKADILSLKATDVGFAQSADLVNYGVATRIGYKVDLPNNFYIEPTAGIEYVRTVFDNGTALSATTLALNNGDAVRAKVGARLGTEWISDQLRIEPSLTAYGYSDVSVSNSALFVGSTGVSLPTDQGKVRGEVQGSVNFFNLQTGWSGFVRGDVRFGENLLAYGGRGGLRYQW